MFCILGLSGRVPTSSNIPEEKYMIKKRFKTGFYCVLEVFLYTKTVVFYFANPMNVLEIRQEHSRDIFSTFLPKKISSGIHEINIYDHSADPAGGI